ncbi:FG-GAP repeat protein [Algoriphagus boseongensis]|uniref:FG-GAP repeat protein n=1 Tax=Algoriphagus boseongensis TaxID=1442587 RepID=A0A4R6T2E9_9BACT|nr:VCBS repeat-containing protein [Algoriphagus boseongensis]TDQ14696.1 FG-GAP repeat protein [Algoriphagus boseongensis]
MKTSIQSFFGLAVLGLLLFSCKKKEENTPSLFTLLPADSTGIGFQNTLTSASELNILEYLYFYNGGGVAAGDLNNDGLIDLYFTGNQVPNKLFLNKGNFKFEDITETAGVSGDGGWSTGVTMGDVNGDGLLDIYVCQVGDLGKTSGKNRLYLNQGDGKFTEEAASFGLDFSGYSTHAAFFDYDRDGDLDLYLLNHNVKSPEVFAKAENRNLSDPSGDKLYKNLLAEGLKGFVDVTEEAGIYSSILGFGLGVAVEDFNGDDWLDLYVSNDFTENDYLYLNNQDGTFRETLQELIPSTSRYSMGNDAADLNGDGFPEIFTTDMLPENPEIWMKSVGEDKAEVYQIKKNFGYGDQYVRNHLQLNQSGKGFSEIALFSEVYASDWSWSPLLFDFDNDGLVDIHVTNGITKRPNDLDFIQYSQDVDLKTPIEELRQKQIEMLPQLKISNFAWKNLGGLRFENQSKTLGLDQESYSNGSVYADLDNDGDLDLVVNNIDQPAFIYQNHSEQSGNNFLKIRLKSQIHNPQGIGGKVTLFAGNQQFSQRISTSRGFQSGPSPDLVFGLGKIPMVDSIAVFWPTGYAELFPFCPANQKLILEEGKGNPWTKPFENLSSPDLELPSIPWRHVEKDEIDFLKREYLAPKSFSKMGPALAVGDVNGDGKEDLYLGGAKDQAGTLLIQNQNGGFDPMPNPIFEQLAKAEDVVAEFGDFNQDGYLDLFVGSGGNENPTGDLFNFDRIFFGDGSGNFIFSMNSLPPIGENTSSVAIADVDGDGDLDLFVGSSVKTGDYGASPKSSLLINNGRGQFKDETALWFGGNVEFGMVNTLQFANLDGDNQHELILTGDWNPIRVFKFANQKATEFKPKGLEFSAGWIQSLEIADLDGNGKPDILVGNLGLNSKLKASSEKPVWLYHHDFDANGQADPLIFHYMGEKLVPFATRDDLIRQIPGVKRTHSSYAEYSKISKPEDLFPKEEIQKARKLPAYEFRSGVYFQQADGSFEFVSFPDPVQWSPVMALAYDEESGSIAIGSNSADLRVDLGKSIQNPPHLLRWNKGQWNLETIQLAPSPKPEIRRIKRIKWKNSSYYLGAENNGPLHWIPLKNLN